jgi:PAS domain S-box-containing protein
VSAPIKVLYVDDNRLDRELVRDVLNKDDGEFEVAEAVDRTEFETLLAAGEWDIVLTDFYMGGFQGLEVIERVKNQQPGVPVVMLTGTGSEEVAVEALKLGAADYVLKKPQHIQRLPFTLRSVLERAQAQEEEHRLTRELRALTRCNQALLRVADEQSLFDEICRIVREVADYRASWVGLVDNDKDRTIHVVASAGDCGKFLAPRCFGWSEDDEHGRGPFGQAIRSGNTVCNPDAVALPLKRQDGEVFGVLTTYPVKANQVTSDDLRLLEELAGDLAYGVATLRSHAKRILAEEALKTSQARLEAAMDLADLVNWELDVDSGIFTFNDRFYALYGTTAALEGGYQMPAEVYVKTFVHSDDQHMVVEAMHKSVETTDPNYSAYLEHRIVRRDGEIRHTFVHHVVIKDKDGRTIKTRGTNQDITERKQAEQERLDLEGRLQQSQRLESLGVLAGGIAHDFNNILMSVLGNAELALTGLSASAPARDNLLEITASSRRAADLCRQMLAYSGRGRLVTEAIDLRALIEDMLGLLQSTISKKALLNLNMGKNLPPMRGDVSQLSQVIMNMVINASEAIGERSGVITISTGVTECTGRYLEKTYVDERLTPGLYLTLEVSDTGCGMDKATQEHLFEPFFTTKFTGRGLGLSAVLGIVRGHKGALRLYSELGKGTTFKILFPASETATESLARANGATKDDWQGVGTILLVDDEETIRTLGVRMLAALGFTVLVAADGREALAVYAEHRDEITLVLLDLTMPHMDGEQTFRELRLMDSGVRVVMSSGYAESDVTARFAGKGLVGFVHKPYSLTELADQLRAALDGAEPGSETAQT